MADRARRRPRDVVLRASPRLTGGERDAMIAETERMLDFAAADADHREVGVKALVSFVRLPSAAGML